MTKTYISDNCVDHVDRVENVADVTQGLGYYSKGDLRCRAVNSGNGFIIRYPARNCVTQDYYVCLDYSQARDLVLALSAFQKELGFNE